MPTKTETATLDCTGGWYTEQEWQGVSVGDLLAQAGILDTADSLTVRAVAGLPTVPLSVSRLFNFHS